MQHPPPFARNVTREITIDLDEIAGRFWSKVDMAGDCWPWLGYINPITGYGQVSLRVLDQIALGLNRIATAPVVACSLSRGSRLSGQEVLHSCDNRPCCRPEHLSWDTHLQNMRDAVERKRVQLGSGHHAARHTDDEIRTAIERVRAGESAMAVARDIDVSNSTLSRWVKGFGRGAQWTNR